MKYTCKLLVIIIIYFFSSNNCLGQATGDNFPVAGKFLGYNGAGIDLDFRTNNINRMQLMESSTNTVDGYFYDNSGFLGISQDPAFFTSKISTSFSLRSIQWIFQVSKSTRCDRSRKVDPYQISFQT